MNAHARTICGAIGIAGATARIYAPALAARAEEGFAVIVIGVDTLAETGPARLLTNVADPLTGRQALVGQQLAELMGIRAGDEIAVVGRASTDRSPTISSRSRRSSRHLSTWSIARAS